MRYSQPKILRTDDAVLAIQHVGVADNDKPIGDYLDTAVSPARNTDISAYEADE
jgi:hypothetical protein